MRQIKTFLFGVLFIVGFTIKTYAGDHPEANFGIYGIQHFASVAQYQQNYVGQVVQYLPERTGGGYIDEKYFQSVGGKFNTDYVVSKISGNDKEMTWLLLEKGTKNKVKMIVNNKDEYYSFGKYCYCITETYSIPLILSEKFKADKSNYIGKVYPDKTNSPIKFEVTDVISGVDRCRELLLPKLKRKLKISSKVTKKKENAVSFRHFFVTLQRN